MAESDPFLAFSSEDLAGMDKEVGVVFLPCGHLVTCTSCAPTVAECVVCRTRISSSVRVYMA